MGRPVILVTNDSLAPTLKAVVQAVDAGADLHILTHREGMTATLDRLVTPESLLVCFSTGVIIPAAVLERLTCASYNFHAASPDYPGRDPHHFAIYEGMRRFGATAHKMVAKVDAGQIVGTEWFDVACGTTPDALCRKALSAALRLYRTLMPRMMHEAELPDIGIAWGHRKRRRQDFHEMCRVEPTISRGEFERRYFAFDGGEYDNLVVVLHGHSFRICKLTTDTSFSERKVYEVKSTVNRYTLEACIAATEAGEFDGLAVTLHGQLFRFESDRIGWPTSHRRAHS